MSFITLQSDLGFKGFTPDRVSRSSVHVAGGVEDNDLEPGTNLKGNNTNQNFTLRLFTDPGDQSLGGVTPPFIRNKDSIFIQGDDSDFPDDTDIGFNSNGSNINQGFKFEEGIDPGGQSRKGKTPSLISNKNSIFIEGDDTTVLDSPDIGFNINGSNINQGFKFKEGIDPTGLSLDGKTPPKFTDTPYSQHVDNPTDPNKVLGIIDKELSVEPRSRTNTVLEQIGVLAKKRLDDVARITTKVINPIENPRFITNQGIIAFATALDASLKASGGKKLSAFGKAAKDGGLDIAKTYGGILASTPVAGTGIHLIFPPAVNNQYLQQSSENPTELLNNIAAFTGITAGSGINGANLAYTKGQVQKGFVTSNFVELNDGDDSVTKIEDLGDLSDNSNFDSNFIYLNNKGGGGKQLAFDNFSAINEILPTDRSKFEPDVNDYSVVSKPENVESNFITNNTRVYNFNARRFEERTTLKGKDPLVEKAKNLNTKVADSVSRDQSEVFFNKRTAFPYISGSTVIKVPERTVGITQDDDRRSTKQVQSIGLRTRLVSTGVSNQNSLDLMDITSINLSENSSVVDDIIPFNIEIYDPQQPENYTLVKLRAYLDSMSDSYTGEWNGTKYVGRAEQLYNYTGFNRDFSFAFKVAALSKQELTPLYNKLNTLVSTTAPNYDNEQNFMQGIFVKLTIGDYLHKVPGFFEKIGLTWDTKYPWELGIEDSSMKVLPHILNVDVTFRPIHNFNPKYGSKFIANVA